MMQLWKGSVIALVSMVAIPTAAPAQDRPQNTVFLEMLGNGGIISINFDRKVSENLSLRAGTGSWGSEGTSWDGREIETRVTTFPLLVNYLGGSGNRRLELGAGVLFGRKTRERSFSEPDESYSFTSLTGVVGYRYQPSRRGMMFRVGATPFVGLGPSETAYPGRGFFPSVGFSGGYSF